MDRNLLVAIALSALVLIGYQEYLRIYYPQPVRPPAGRGEAGGEPAPTPLPSVALEGVAPPATTASSAARRTLAVDYAGDVEVETELFSARFSSKGGRLVSMKLKHYRTSVDAHSPPLELVHLAPDGEPPLGVTLRGKEAASDAEVSYAVTPSALRLVDAQQGELRFRGTLAEGTIVEKRLAFAGDRYVFTVGLVVSGAPAGYSEAALGWTHAQATEHSSYSYVGAEALVGGKLQQLHDADLEKGVLVPAPGSAVDPSTPIHWAGFSDGYFLSALCPRENERVRLWGKLRGREAVTEILVPLGTVADPGYPFTVYTGPKDTSALSEAGHHLVRAVNLGWFSFVAEPMLAILKSFHRFTGNYGFDIILLTVLVKLAMIPLTHKSYKSMQELQKLQPQMKRLQEKYADDRAALNKEMMELYKRHNVNPLGGCLPMVLQMPVFIGLYNALLSAVELRHAPFALWINDLSAPDRLPPMTADPLAVIAGYPVRIPVLTLLMGASMLVQQRMTPQAGDPAQQRIMMFMPLVFTAMFINFPAGLVIYWLVNNVLTIAQQAIMQRRAR